MMPSSMGLLCGEHRVWVHSSNLEIGMVTDFAPEGTTEG